MSDRSLSRRAASLLGLCSALVATVVSAADVYVVEARIERPGVSALAPTFIVTPGERALVAFDEERDIDVAMTVLPRSGSGTGDTLELRVELVDGDSRYDETVEASLTEPLTLRLGERELEVSVRERPGLEEESSDEAER